jgi:hypothetical protein
LPESPYFLLAALAVIVNPAAGIAEFHSASTLHVVAALRFFDPEFAFGALLEFGSADELLERFLLAIYVLVRLVLSARQIFMPGHSTLKAILLLALGTFEFIIIVIRIVNECVHAIGSGAPGYVPLF